MIATKVGMRCARPIVIDSARSSFNLKKSIQGLESGSKERKTLENVLKRIGEEGKGRVSIAFGDAGATDEGVNLGRTVGNRITLDFEAVDQVRRDFGLSASEGRALDAVLVAHEGEHAGGGLFLFSLMNMSRERTALFTESYTYQGLRSTDRIFNLWNESWLTADKDKLSIERNRELAIEKILHPPKGDR
jgi:hypothetical protein